MAACTITVVTAVSVLATTVVSPDSTTVLTKVTAGGVDVSRLVTVVRVTVETVAAVRNVCTGGL
jgi:hypothetical protein